MSTEYRLYPPRPPLARSTVFILMFLALGALTLVVGVPLLFLSWLFSAPSNGQNPAMVNDCYGSHLFSPYNGTEAFGTFDNGDPATEATLQCLRDLSTTQALYPVSQDSESIIWEWTVDGVLYKIVVVGGPNEPTIGVGYYSSTMPTD